MINNFNKVKFVLDDFRIHFIYFASTFSYKLQFPHRSFINRNNLIECILILLDIDLQKISKPMIDNSTCAQR